MGKLRDGLTGVIAAVAAGAVAALLLAPKRRTGSRVLSRGTAAAADIVLDVGQAVSEWSQGLWRRLGADQPSGVSGDERITLRIQEEMERRGIWSRRLDVTTVDGTVFLRGREPDTARIETILAMIRGVPGVVDIVDEIHHE